MANIAQAIQQGTAQQSAEVSRLGGQMRAEGEAGRQHIKDTMAVEAFELQKQAIYDEKAGGWMQTHAALQVNRDTAQGKLDAGHAAVKAAVASGDAKKIKAAQGAIPALQGAVDIAAGQMGKLIAGTTGDPRMSEMLKRSSFSNESLRKILSGVMADDTVPQAMKDQINTNVSMMQQVQQELAATEQAEQNVIAAEQAGAKYAAQTLAFHEATGAYTAGQLAKQTASANAKVPIEEKSSVPGQLISGLGDDSVTKGTPLDAEVVPMINQKAKVMAAKIDALKLKEEHFNTESDMLGESYVNLYKAWGEEVERATAENVYPDPQALADRVNILSKEIAASKATPQAKTMYDELNQLITSIVSDSKDKNSDDRALNSLALGALIERTKTEFVTSTKGRAKLQPRATGDSN